MNILLINTNPVVSRLVPLSMQDERIVFEEVSHVSEATKERYDVVFVDDMAYDDACASFLSQAEVGRVVFLSGRDSGEEIGTLFDTVIKKPFLPSQIEGVLEEAAVIDSFSQVRDADTFTSEETNDSESIRGDKEDTPTIFPLSSDDEEKDFSDENDKGEEEQTEAPLVLDEKELEEIKALLEENEELPDEQEIPEGDSLEAKKVEVITKKLEEEGLEIMEEAEMIAKLSETPKKKKRKKKKKSEEIYTFEEALLAAVENMKPKKIKKLLKGAEVTIKIRFKDEI